jgi:hypothetical protein
MGGLEPLISANGVEELEGLHASLPDIGRFNQTV